VPDVSVWQPPKREDLWEAAAPGARLAPAPDVELDPRFRKLSTLHRLVTQHSDQFPERLEEWRLLLYRLADSAHDGVLPADMDGVIHTLFFQLLSLDPDVPAEPFWKKEVRLRKGPKAPKAPKAAKKPKPEKAQAPRGDETPFWKKEISLRKRPAPVAAPAPAPVVSAPDPPAVEAVVVQPEPEPTSLSLERALATYERTPASEPVAETPIAETVEPEPQRSELERAFAAYGRPAEPEPAIAELPVVAEPEPAPAPVAPSLESTFAAFSRPQAEPEQKSEPEPLVAEVPALAEPSPAAVAPSLESTFAAFSGPQAEPEQKPEPEPLVAEVRALAEPSPAAVAPSLESTFAAFSRPQAEPEQPEPAVVESPAAEELQPARASLESAFAAFSRPQMEADPEPESVDVATPEPARAPTAPSLESDFASFTASQPEPEPVSTAASLEAASVPPPVETMQVALVGRAGVASPVVETEQTPFWKKELSFGKKSKSPEPKAVETEREPKAAPTPFWKKELSFGKKSKSAEPKPEKAKSETKVASTPFWKKELSLGKKSKTAEPKPVKERQPKPASTPFWKKELSLGKRSKSAEPKPVKQREPKTPSTPFWKKELSFPKKSKSAEPTPSKAEREPKTKSTPFWKKELSFSKSRAPKEPKAPKEQKGSVMKREVHLPSIKLPALALRREPKADLAKVVGLRIGSSQLAAALVHNNGSAELLQLARSPLERGIVASGEVRDSDALANALKRFFAAHKLPRQGVRLGVATNRIGVRVLEVVANDDPKLFANSVRFRAQEVVPIPLADAVLDHIPLGKTADGESERVLIVFAHKELVDGYVTACNRAGLKLAGIDFDAFALLRALSGKPDPAADAQPKEAALVAVAIGHERTIFAVSEGSICDFARVLEWGGSALDQALARALDVPLDLAEQMKQTISLSGDADGGLNGVQLEAARMALRQELQLLARELVSSLQFYQSRADSLAIGEVLLTGGGAQLEGLADELAKQLGVPVRRGNPLEHVTFSNALDPPASMDSLAIAVGLGIEV
jgi:type IV pilus assembly protein PilM